MVFPPASPLPVYIVANEQRVMKQPKSMPNKRTPQPPHIIRHYETLSPEETDEAVESVADLIVNFVQKRAVAPDVKRSGAGGQSSSENRGKPRSRKEKGHR